MTRFERLTVRLRRAVYGSRTRGWSLPDVCSASSTAGSTAGVSCPVSTRTTPAITSAIPNPIVSVNGSSKTADAMTVVRATPAAAQMP